jgi:tRNA(Ile)-lysidine synthase
MIEKVKKAIQEHSMLGMGDRVVVAVSGGPDSVALLKVLEMVSGDYGLTLISAHLHHGIRGEEADRDEQFVKQLSQDMSLAFVSDRIHVPVLKKGTGKSIEEIGREERYWFLKDVAEKHGAQKIALGHHLHDQAETVIMNLLRGSGAEGLRGMLPVRDGMFIRPLLGIRRKEILDFLEERQIPYMLDPSNDSNVYLRNRIRHRLIPELKEQFNPNLEESLGSMSEILRLEDDYMKIVTGGILTELGVKLCDKEIRIKISDLRIHHPAIQNRMIKTFLEQFSPSGKGIGSIHVKAVINLSDSKKPGGRVNLPYGIHVWREYDCLCFGRQKKESIGSHAMNANEKLEELFYTVSIPDTIRIHELGKTMSFDLVQPPKESVSDVPNIAYMDYDKIAPPLVVRTIRPGDRIQPLGMEGTKKLKSYFIDRKVPRGKRREIPLLVDGESVIWIAGMRLNERVKITNKSRKILKVEIV